MPAIFFGYGKPMNAVLKNAYTDGWAAVGNSIPRPKAILCVSAHWYLPGTAVTAMPLPSINETREPEFHYQVGNLLQPLRDEGVLVRSQC